MGARTGAGTGEGAGEGEGEGERVKGAEGAEGAGEGPSLEAIGSYHVERISASNMKRTFVGYGADRDWYDATQGEGMEFLREATEVKNIWAPMGDRI